MTVQVVRVGFLQKQELSYRQQIARQVLTQYAEGIYMHRDLEIKVKCHSRSLETEPLDRSYTSYLTLNTIVTLKYGLEVTERH